MARGREKFLSLLGIMVLALPLALIVFAISPWLIGRPTNLILGLLVEILAATLIGSYLAFGTCGIMIHDLRLIQSAWASLLISLNNFFRVLPIIGGSLLVRFGITMIIILGLSLGLNAFDDLVISGIDYASYEQFLNIPLVDWSRWILDIVLYPFETTMLVFCYMSFTERVSYPPLRETDKTA
jgi:hypothetical protein